METTEKTIITIQAEIKASLAKVWKYWNQPEHIVNWNFATDEWQCPKAENDLRVGGKLKSRMEAKDGSMGFDFEGIYTEVKENELIAFTMGDGRTVKVEFKETGDKVLVTERFEAEQSNPVEMQKSGWQAILDNFKKYAEGAGW